MASGLSGPPSSGDASAMQGGFSDAERQRLAGTARRWVPGGRVLRAETAVLVGRLVSNYEWKEGTHPA